MSASDEALLQLEKAAADVLRCAESTLGGVGLSCFATNSDQDDAFARARAKRTDAKRIVRLIADFKSNHGSFK